MGGPRGGYPLWIAPVAGEFVCLCVCVCACVCVCVCGGGGG
jgi:hypothetical protein